ncbi:MAG: fibronectin-binding autotransporter adhesin [Candidatus Promineifilaceae bacterium]|jgi:fibronectin-binding autotransporter adhesin
MSNLFRHGLTLGVALLLSATTLQAGNGTWRIAADGFRWDDSQNWLGEAVADGAGFNADFASLDPRSDVRIHLDSSRTLGHLTFGDTEQSSAASWILDNYGDGGNVLALSSGGPSITVHALGSGKAVRLTASIAGAEGFAKSGLGTLVFAAPMTYAGQTVLNGGTLALGIDHAINVGQALQVNDEATLDLAGRHQFVGALSNTSLFEDAGGIITGTGGRLTANTLSDATFAGSFQGAASLIKTGGRTLTLTRPSPTTGALAVIGGRLSVRERNTTTPDEYGLGLMLKDEGSFSNVNAVVIRNATLTLDNHYGTTDMANRINDTAPITLDNGSIRFVGRQNVRSVETLGHVTASGFASITMLVAGNPSGVAGTHSSEVRLAGLTRKRGAMLQFNRASGVNTPLGQAGDNRARVILADTNGLTIVNNTVVGMSIYNDNDKYYLVSYDPSLGFGTATSSGFSDTETLQSAAPTTDFLTARTQTVKAGGQTINSLGIQGASIVQVDNPIKFANTNDTLTIASGWMGTWFAQTQIGEMTNRGAITSGQSELFVFGGGTLHWGSGANIHTIHSVIKDNGTSPLTLSLNLGRHTYLTANNTYSGGTVVNGMIGRDTGRNFYNNLFLQGEPGSIVIPNALNPEDGLVMTSANVTMQNNAGQIGSSNIATLIGGTRLTLVGDNTLAGVVFNSNGGTAVPTLEPGGVLTVTGDISSVPENLFVTPIITGGSLSLNGATSTVSVTAMPDGVYANGIGPLNGLRIQSTIQNGGLTKTGTGVLNLTGNNLFEGALTVADGVLSVSSVNNAGTSGPLGNSSLPVTLGATLAYTGNSATSTKPFVLFTVGTVFVDSSATALTLSGLIEGDGLNKAGAGTLVLANANTYDGPTRVTGGALQISSDANLGTAPGAYRAADITLDQSATLALNADFALNANRGIVLGTNGVQTITSTGGGAIPLPGGISGEGSVAFLGSPGQLSLAHTNTYTGETRVRGITRLIPGGEAAFQFSTLTEAPGGSIFAYPAPGSALFGGLAGRFDLALQTVSGGPAPVALSVGNNNRSTTFAGVLSGVGSLEKIGSGRLTLSGHNSYSGPTMVSAGTLTGQTDASCSNTIVTVGSGAAGGVHVISPDTHWTCAGLTYAAGTSAADFYFEDELGTATAPLHVAGNLAFNGTLNVGVGPATRIIPSGTYPLWSYTGILGGTSPAAPTTLPPGLVATINHNVTNKTLDLVVSKGNEVTWGVGNGVWDIDTTANWSDPGDAVLTYADGEAVRFDDSASGGSDIQVTVDVNVSPLRISVDNDTKDYTLTGSGSIGAAATALIKQGAGRLTIETPTTYGGGTTLSGGTLALAGVGRLSDTGALSVHNGSTFDIGTVSDTIGRLTLTHGHITGTLGTLISPQYTISNTGGVSSVSAILAGASSLDKSGAGTLILSRTNSYSGATTIIDGVVSVTALANGGSPSGIGRSGKSAVNLILNGGTLRYTGDSVTTDRDMVLIDGSVNTIDVAKQGTSLVLSGTSAATSGALIKAGSGTLVLLGNHAYSGGTTIDGGELQIGDGGAVGTMGSGPLVNNAALIFDRSDNAYNLSEAIQGTGSIVKRGSGIVTLSKTNIYAGSTTIESGTLRITGANLPTTTRLDIEIGATVDLNYDGINEVAYLVFDGESQFAGTWGRSGSGAEYINDTYLSERGLLLVRHMFSRDGAMLILR